MLSVLSYLICSSCKSSKLDISNVDFKESLYDGFITCSDCKSTMSFEKGILNLLKDDSISANESRNSDAYSDFWERGKADAEESVVTHEDALLNSWSDKLKGNVFLDAGCGNGRHISHWLKYDYSEMIFVDISDAIYDCQKRYIEAGGTAKDALFIKGTLNSIPLKKESVDVTWSSGTLGLVDNQKEAFEEIIRVSSQKVNLSVLTDKTFTGKVYICANIVKPIVNRINNFSLLYKLTGLVAFFILLILKFFHFCGMSPGFLKRDTLEKIVKDENSLRRLQWGLYDPVIIPKIKKYPDQFYFDIAQNHFFGLDHHQTEIISDYYFFKKMNSNEGL